MFTSDTDKNKRNSLRNALIYLLIAIFLALLGAIYEMNSNGVYSYFMLYAFVLPLTGGALPFLIFSMTDKILYPIPTARSLWHWGIATLSVGSVFCGIIEIYGTSNPLSTVYWIAGFAMCISAATIYAVDIILRIKKDK